MTTAPAAFLSPEQYLEIERAAELRSEYRDGRMFPRNLSTMDHCLIGTNTLVRLWERLRDRDGDVFGNNLRLFMPEPKVFAYPDVTVTHGRVQVLDHHDDTVTDATVIVEVLSPVRALMTAGISSLTIAL